MNNIICLNI
jgi:fatty acid omega-hydroxylase